MKVALLMAVMAIAGVSALSVTHSNIGDAFAFTQWSVSHNKYYGSTAEYDHAFHNFQSTLKRLAAHKAIGRKGFGLTKFADLSPEEFRARYLMPKGNVAANIKAMKAQFSVAKADTTIAPPSTFNWVSKGATTPVKDQQDCGSCWAFSTTENFESMTFLAGNGLPVLGPQQLVDCDPQSQGCGGGWTYWAFQYLLTAGGQESETEYPYTAQDGTCAFDASKITAKISNYTFATQPCESGSCPVQDDTLRTQLVSKGPVSICVNAGSWSDWTGPEPLMGADCPGDADELDHCVQLVGYSWPDNYWIVRNSWNTDWGQAGFIYLQTGQNTCGLGDVVTYADVPKAVGKDHHRRH